MNLTTSERLIGWRGNALPKLFSGLILVGSPMAGTPLDAQSNPDANAPNLGPLSRQKFVRVTGDALGYELRPSFSGRYKGAEFRTNRWGMRDKDYEMKRPKNTYRVALIGSSYGMAGGVPDDQSFEWLLEERLNREGPGVPRRHFEILNFAVGGYGILQGALTVDRKVFAFEPEAVLVTVHSNEIDRMTRYLSQLVRAKIRIGYPFIDQKLEEVGARPEMEDPEIIRRIAPIAPAVVEWTYLHILRECTSRRIRVIGLPFPEPLRAPENLLEVSRLAARAGLRMMEVANAYGSYPLDSVRLGGLRNDPHLSLLGHRLVAARLYESLQADDSLLLHLGFQRSH